MQLQTSTSQSADQPGGETSNPLTKDASKDNKAEDAQAKLKGNTNIKKSKNLHSPSESALKIEDDDENDQINSKHTKQWQKRDTKVNLLSENSLFSTYIAVNLVSGREVLWNEIDFSSIGFSAKQKESIEASINTIVKLKSHSFVANSLDYWVTDKSSSSDETKNIYKLYIITENFGSVSLYHFLKSIKNNVGRESWISWCRQILLALNFLHTQSEPIIHGSINSQTVYFDYDGIIKLCFIGFKSKTFYGKFTIKQIEKSSLKSPFNYIPQECRRISVKTKKVDIFDFGLVALEIATKPLENFSVHYTPYTLCQTLKDADIMKFISKCISFNPDMRPLSHELMLQNPIFTIPKLKHLILSQFYKNETLIENFFESSSVSSQNRVLMENVSTNFQMRESDFKIESIQIPLALIRENLESSIVLSKQLKKSLPDVYSDYESDSNDTQIQQINNKYEKELRHIINMETSIDPSNQELKLEIYFDDETCRTLRTKLTTEDNGTDLSESLERLGLIRAEYVGIIATEIQEKISNSLIS